PLSRRARADGLRAARQRLDRPGAYRTTGAASLYTSWGRRRWWHRRTWWVVRGIRGCWARSAARGVDRHRLRHGEADITMAFLAEQVRRARDDHDVTRLRLQRVRQANDDLIRRNGALREQPAHERRVHRLPRLRPSGGAPRATTRRLGPRRWRWSGGGRGRHSRVDVGRRRRVVLDRRRACRFRLLLHGP